MAYNNNYMKSLIIFLIWLAIAVIGVIAKAVKKSQEQGSTPPGQARTGPNGTFMTDKESRGQQLKQMWERQRGMNRSQSDELNTETVPGPEPRPEPVIEENPLAEEGIAAIETSQETASPAPTPKNREMDFDPVEMVVYSEVMEPGYEKY